MKTKSRRRAIQVLVGAALALAVAQPAAAAWPDDKPIEVVVGYAAGGGTDVMARKLFQSVQKRLGDKAKIVVINKPGAAGEIASAYLTRSAPDGYTIGVVNLPPFVVVPMIKKAQYSVDDVRFVARVVDDPTVLVVRADSRFKSLGDLLAALREKPGTIALGHNGTGTNSHLAIRLLAEATKVAPNEVPYKGTAAQKTDVLGGHLDVGLISVGEVPELHGGATGDMRVLAQLSDARSPALPGVPTAREAGVAVVMSSERGVAVPKGVPEAIVQKLEAAIAESVRDPEFIAASPGDAPVLAYLPGAQWQASLAKSMDALRKLADSLPK
ncbi:tripartite tricarboxylate transporter substrate binding protein [Rhodoplanes sp. SY1]|uniref:tripartite tricarboxylate transporter substrate binding protein n=1 Tax=Rhodoplanes sp. SY1 TaxID=3166646 RepID=UPI0038B6ACDB